MGMIVVNLYGGPGTGKSTIAAQVFANLKWRGINCELVTEFAKGKVWSEHFSALDDQIYILGNQHNKLFRLRDKVNIAVTDSPLLLARVYGKNEPESFHNLVKDLYYSYTNLNFFLTRNKPFQKAGRVQDEKAARELDERIREILQDSRVWFDTVEGTQEAAETITEETIKSLKIVNKNISF